MSYPENLSPFRHQLARLFHILDSPDHRLDAQTGEIGDRLAGNFYFVKPVGFAFLKILTKKVSILTVTNGR